MGDARCYLTNRYGFVGAMGRIKDLLNMPELFLRFVTLQDFSWWNYGDRAGSSERVASSVIAMTGIDRVIVAAVRADAGRAFKGF
jgi:hypothetical protein